MSETNYILAVDPGKTTGYALWDLRAGEFFGSGEKGFGEFCADSEAWMRVGGAETLLVVERFIINMATAKNSQAPWSLEVIGVLRYFSEKYEAAGFELQQASAAKTFASNDRLRQIGWYVPRDHERDARRHLLLALVNNGFGAPEGTLLGLQG